MREKSLKIMLVILLLAVLGLGGYIVYDKFLSKELNKKEVKEETKKEESQKEDLDAIANILVNKLDKYYVDYYDHMGSAIFNNVSDEDKMEAAFLYGNDFKLKKVTVEDYYKNLFGISLTTYPDFKCWNDDGLYAKYNNEKQEYEAVGEHGHGGSGSFGIKASIIKKNSIEKSGDNYIMTVTKVFAPANGMVESPENAFYADQEYTVKIDELKQFAKTDSNGNWDTADIEGAKKYYEENYDKFKDIKPQYKYTFKKENDDYYLVSFETIK